MNQVSVMKIANGYTVTTIATNPAQMNGNLSVTFCADLAAVNTLLASIFNPPAP